MLSFFLRGVLDEILNLIESVSEDFPSTLYCCNCCNRVILLLAVPRRLFCFGSLVVLGVVFRYLSLC